MTDQSKYEFKISTTASVHISKHQGSWYSWIDLAPHCTIGSWPGDSIASHGAFETKEECLWRAIEGLDKNRTIFLEEERKELNDAKEYRRQLYQRYKKEFES
jgi:hypothetical protein